MSLAISLFIVHDVVQITDESFLNLLEHVSILGHQCPVRLLADFSQVAQTGLHCLSGITFRNKADRLGTGSNSWSPGNCRENVVPIVLRCHQLQFLEVVDIHVQAEQLLEHHQVV